MTYIKKPCTISNMNRKIMLFALFCAFTSCLSVHDSFAYIEKDTAVLHIMNKAAGKTQVISAKKDKNIHIDGLTIKVRNCKQSDPFDAENYFAFVEIYTKSDTRIFSGWMNHNEPGQNPLQDDAYDVWLDKCE